MTAQYFRPTLNYFLTMPIEPVFSWELFRETPVIGILRGLTYDQCRRAVEAGLETGFRTWEITMNTDGTEELIRALLDEYTDINVGAGTVCTLEDYERAVAAGAQFIVMPILDEEVIVSAVAEGLPVFPGAFTPTEIYRAWSLGATAVKLFPAGQLGAGYVRDLKAPLGEIRLLPTGGIDRQNIRTYFEAGVMGVGMGSGLVDRKLLDGGDHGALHAHFRSVRNLIADLL